MNAPLDPPNVATGLDRLVGDRFAMLRGRRVAAICNPTSVDCRMNHLADHLAAADCKLIALFGPEHGIRGAAQDMIGVAASTDARTGVPVHSLYGSSVEDLTPTAADLDGIDLLIFDIQDVGSRYYTFAATMLYAMRAAADLGIDFLVLDRPNPIGGVMIEGPLVQPGFESFVGAHPLPIRHGMTVGELASLFRAELKLDLDLKVLPCEGWTRTMTWPETGIPWVAPSPNMPTFETALVYPGGCLIEGTNLSEGRGTTRPFELWGAPWLEAGLQHAASEFLDENLSADPVALLRPGSFLPTFHKHAGSLCFGFQPHVRRVHEFRPVTLYTRFLSWARRQAPGDFAWRTEPYEFIAKPIAIDLLFGSDQERRAIDAGNDPREIAASWTSAESEFLERRRDFLLYI